VSAVLLNVSRSTRNLVFIRLTHTCPIYRSRCCEERCLILLPVSTPGSDKKTLFLHRIVKNKRTAADHFSITFIQLNCNTLKCV
jgi:sigma54-dependent transcription regulator